MVINWHGKPVSVTPKQQLEGGDWLVTAKENGPRFTIGSTLRIKASEVIEIAAAEIPEGSA